MRFASKGRADALLTCYTKGSGRTAEDGKPDGGNIFRMSPNGENENHGMNKITKGFHVEGGVRNPDSGDVSREDSTEERGAGP